MTRLHFQLLVVNEAFEGIVDGLSNRELFIMFVVYFAPGIVRKQMLETGATEIIELFFSYTTIRPVLAIWTELRPTALTTVCLLLVMLADLRPAAVATDCLPLVMLADLVLLRFSSTIQTTRLPLVMLALLVILRVSSTIQTTRLPLVMLADMRPAAVATG